MKAMKSCGKVSNHGMLCFGSRSVQRALPIEFVTLTRRRRSRLCTSAAPPDLDVDELVDRASATLEKAREALSDVQRDAAERSNTAAPTFIPSTLTFGAPLSIQEPQPSAMPDEPNLRPSGDSQSSLNGPTLNVEKPPRPDLHSMGRSSNSAPPPPPPSSSHDAPWNSNVDQAPTMILQRQAVNKEQPTSLAFAEPSTVAELSFETKEASQSQEEAQLPPFQSVLQLTAAHLPPKQQGAQTVDGEAEVEMRGESEAGHMLKDGKGTLADGSTWERISGEEFGDNGYWCRWWVLRGTALGGQVQWEETWWESSDWSGMREMGAQKVGCNVGGDAWREAWKERVYHVAGSGEPCVERSAHKWATDGAAAEEWEEKWGEEYSGSGAVHKWADKWGKRGDDVWHEKWGEDYARDGDACLKWTDRWSETMLPDGRQRAQGDKWREEFGQGNGNKTGETWHADENGHRYHRSWGENHFGDGWVQKYGHSTAGEQWDVTDQSGTYYNPMPHFNFQMALDHSPDLLTIPVKPREATLEEFMDGGIDDF